LIMNDWEYVSAYVQGDEEAFEGLVAKYFRMVYAMAARQVGDAHLAEEVAQSVFIIFSRKASKLAPGVSVCGWLLQTTRFVSRDAIKMRQRRLQNEQAFAASLDCGSPTKTSPNAIEAVLDEALLALPAAEQTGVMAHFYEGKNFREIGEMLAISEDGAQKRVSRSLAKLRAFLSRRGVKVSMSAVAGLLTTQFAGDAAAQTLSSANALSLADRASRLLRWRSVLGIGLKLILAVALLLGGSWTWRQRSNSTSSTVPVSDPRIEALAKNWSEMVHRIASVKQNLATTPVNDARFQTLLSEVNSFAGDAARIRDALSLLLTAPQERDQVAEFLTEEVAETLKLDSTERRAVYALVRDRLARGATPTEAMKAMAQDIPTEAVQIKALLSAEHQKQFDSVYGADGSGFFIYLRIATAGK